MNGWVLVNCHHHSAPQCLLIVRRKVIGGLDVSTLYKEGIIFTCLLTSPSTRYVECKSGTSLLLYSVYSTCKACQISLQDLTRNPIDEMTKSPDVLLRNSIKLPYNTRVVVPTPGAAESWCWYCNTCADRDRRRCSKRYKAILIIITVHTSKGL